jgi:hypothetical protein
MVTEADVVQALATLLDPQKRLDQLLLLTSEEYASFPRLGEYVWNVPCVATALLMELLTASQHLRPFNLPSETVQRVCATFFLFERIAAEPSCAVDFVTAQLPVYTIPFLQCPSRAPAAEALRASALPLFVTLAQSSSPAIHRFLRGTDFVPTISFVLDRSPSISRRLALAVLARVLCPASQLSLRPDGARSSVTVSQVPASALLGPLVADIERVVAAADGVSRAASADLRSRGGRAGSEGQGQAGRASAAQASAAATAAVGASDPVATIANLASVLGTVFSQLDHETKLLTDLAQLAARGETAGDDAAVLDADVSGLLAGTLPPGIELPASGPTSAQLAAVERRLQEEAGLALAVTALLCEHAADQSTQQLVSAALSNPPVAAALDKAGLRDVVAHVSAVRCRQELRAVLPKDFLVGPRLAGLVRNDRVVLEHLQKVASIF